MKTAVSVPQDVYEEAERLARQLQVSRSELYSRAIAEFICRHAPDRITETLDRLVDQLEDGDSEFVAKSSRRVLDRGEWS